MQSIKLLFRLINTFSRRRRIQILLVTISLIFSAVLDVISIGSIIPFIGILVDADATFLNPSFNKYFLMVGFKNPDELVMPLTGLFISLVWISTSFRMLIFWASNRIAISCGNDLSCSIYSKVLNRSFADHLASSSDEVVNSIVNNVNTTIFNGLYTFLLFLSSIILSTAIFSILIYLNPKIFLLAIATIILFYAPVVLLVQKRLHTNSIITNNSQKIVIKMIQESLSGIREIILKNLFINFLASFKQADYKLRRTIGSNKFIGESPKFVIEALALSLMAIFAFVIITSPSGVDQGLATLGVIALGAQKIIPNLQQIYRGYSSIVSSHASMEDVLKIIGSTIAPQKSADAKFDYSQEFLSINFKNVSYQYSRESPIILNDVNLEIKSGDIVGIIGGTGSGKSTLIDLFLGLLKPSHGQIQVNGHQLIDAIDFWHKKISHVPQSIFLANDSLRNNIAFGIDEQLIDRKKIEYSSAITQLNKLIDSKVDGLLEKVGESGAKLSGGQIQRLGLARAIYREAEVLVLDEATSALDRPMEEKVMDAIYEIYHKKRTLLIISHNIEVLAKCTKILEIKDSRLVTYSSLSEYQNSKQSH
ncbi:ABC transporter ATP-binding protein/permease [Gammaproteobacteria bacterium]|nr:ABC transporter ATP-binding protein/permease [Gammaproteobacteria bacterium]